MIARLTGTVVTKAVEHIVLDVRDVGYHVSIPLSTYYDLPEIGASVSILVHTYVREDTFQLFGFLTVDERDLFDALLRVTKVGPKLALAMLSGMSAGDLQQAIIEGCATPERGARCRTQDGRTHYPRIAGETRQGQAELGMACDPEAMLRRWSPTP
jgi:hypothetical protein